MTQKNYKKTLLLPKTKFPMKANLASKEKQILQKWENLSIYQKLLTKNRDNKFFLLHDGPPYANGKLHIGHALNKILKDFVVKSKLIQGYHAPYIPGWDTHGLPIAHKVATKFKNHKKMLATTFRKKCQEYALSQVNSQKEQFLRLGVFGDFSNHYLTNSKEYVLSQLEVFFKMYEKKLIYKDLKPVYWSYSSKTALAEAEIEYIDKVSPSLYAGFKVNNGQNILEPKTIILVWTTTPWTLPANTGIAIDSKVTYGVYQNVKEKIIIASNLAKQISTKLNLKLKLIKQVKGHDLIGITYHNPFVKRLGKIVQGHHVLITEGTGLVHMAPAHGEDDYIVAKKYNLEIVNYIDDKGCFYQDAPVAQGMFIEKANDYLCQILKQQKLFFNLTFFTHSYPHDWRTKKPVIFRATPQWFISIQKIKTQLIKSIDQVEWIPIWGKTRMMKMMQNRHDWCISRQRLWGVPIPIIYGENHKPIIDSKLNVHLLELFKKWGIDAWFEKPLEEFLPSNYTHKFSPNGNFFKEKDIMDVWFDSGSSWNFIMKKFNFSLDETLYLEGFDQYRGWFNSSLVTSIATTNKPPYKIVLSHGFVLDKNGEKMSKSKGNVTSQEDIIKDQGVDILRLWVSYSNYNNDVRISKEIIDQVVEHYKSIRYKIRFALSNLFDYEYNQKYMDSLSLIDQAMICQLNTLVKTIKTLYNEFKFNLVLTKVNKFLNELSTEYYDFIKDILYVKEANSLQRRVVQTVLYHVVNKIIVLISPILPFTMEEFYTHFFKPFKQESIFLEAYPSEEPLNNQQEILSYYQLLKTFKKDLLKQMEITRQANTFGKPAEAYVHVLLKPKFKKLQKAFNLKEILMVAQIDFYSSNTFFGKEYDSCYVKVEKKEGIVCLRCRFIVCSTKIFNQLCQECNELVKSFS